MYFHKDIEQDIEGKKWNVSSAENRADIQYVMNAHEKDTISIRLSVVNRNRK